ncbi:hypothetical protein [Nonomuraea sp. NPDC048901]|uniref:hypothetical protein n=1 Tax=Nonomuraea sp. NPDC048901 TaxID=3155627 RepID=UPI00340BF7BB
MRDLVCMSQSEIESGLDAAEMDRVLYCAHRDVRGDITCADGAAIADGICPLDTVRYAGGVLATGEVVRSIGHWNPADQWEIFEVQQGSVTLLVQQLPGAPIHLIRGLPGEMYYLAPGSWHTTYVACDDAVVSNVYLYSRTDASEGKYMSDCRPPAATLRQNANGRVYVAEAEARQGSIFTWTGDSAPVAAAEFGSLSDMPSGLMAKAAASLGQAARAAQSPFVRLVPSTTKGGRAHV